MHHKFGLVIISRLALQTYGAPYLLSNEASWAVLPAASRRAADSIGAGGGGGAAPQPAEDHGRLVAAARDPEGECAPAAAAL